jgi:hypothetical protein
MNVQYPYRAVIFGEEYIVKGWRGRKLVTNKGSFFARHVGGDSLIQNHRLVEVASVQADGNGGWLVNGKLLSTLEKLPMSIRLAGIPDDENLRVDKDKICAVAWIENGNTNNVTSLLDSIIEFWDKASQPAAELKVLLPSENLTAQEKRNEEILNKIRENKESFAAISDPLNVLTRLKNWSKPIWLTEFRAAAQKIPISPQQKQLARIATELDETKAQLRKAEAAAQNTLEEAISKWMGFDPPKMSADTKARISKAVQIYSTNPEKRSLSKIAAEFGVSRKTVSDWFKKFKEETG